MVTTTNYLYIFLFVLTFSTLLSRNVHRLHYGSSVAPASSWGASLSPASSYLASSMTPRYLDISGAPSSSVLDSSYVLAGRSGKSSDRNPTSYWAAAASSSLTCLSSSPSSFSTKLLYFYYTSIISSIRLTDLSGSAASPPLDSSIF